jgi:endo-1,4-beta-xylanase
MPTNPTKTSSRFFSIALGSLLGAITVLLLSPAAWAQISPGPKYLGNILPHNHAVPPSFSTYWNQVTPENSGKWGSVEGTRDVMDWSSLDVIYAYAKSHGYPFKQHTFIWGNQQPSWLSGLSAAEQAAEVEEWISLFAQRYPDTDWVDVVNEPFHAPPAYKDAIGGDGATGWDWVIWSFQKARQYLPTAKLFLNEYGLLGGDVTPQQYADLANLLVAQGLLDGIGVQSHINNRGLDPVLVKSRLDQLTALIPVPIHISEYGVDAANDNTQRNIYQAVFPVFWEHPNVSGVTGWGYIQGLTWKANSWILASNEVTERPALVWLKSYASTPPPPPPPPGLLAPTNLTTTAVSTSQINLAWTDNATAETSYEVERSVGSDPFANVAVLGADSTSYPDTGLQRNVLYNYRVRACNATACSPYSNTASTRTKSH